MLVQPGESYGWCFRRLLTNEPANQLFNADRVQYRLQIHMMEISTASFGDIVSDHVCRTLIFCPCLISNLQTSTTRKPRLLSRSNCQPTENRKAWLIRQFRCSRSSCLVCITGKNRFRSSLERGLTYGTFRDIDIR